MPPSKRKGADSSNRQRIVEDGKANIVDLIEIGKSYPFSNHDMMKLADNEANLVTYTQLAHQHRDLDEPGLLGDQDVLFLLYMSKPHYGHWTVLIRHDNETLSFFDSYGKPPDAQLDAIRKMYSSTPRGQTFLRETGQDRNVLSDMIKRSRYKRILYNAKPLQTHAEGELGQSTSTCGRWCGLRAALKDVPLEKFQRIFEVANADWYVTALTLFVH